MQIVVLTDKELKEELLSRDASFDSQINWVDDVSMFHQFKQADVFIDLLFSKEHVHLLQSLLPKLVIINSVEDRLSETNASFVRINGWPTFLQSSVVEASCLNENLKSKAEQVFALFQKKLGWLPDTVGLVTPRVISMIINEAHLALEEGVSTKEQIDTAMKLGTNYPYGPFEWCGKIGKRKIGALLHRLSKDNQRYTPSSLLVS